MKNFLFFMGLFFIFILFFGCKSSAPVVTSASPQQLEVEKPTVFKEVLRKNISINDSLFFYNSLQINLEGVYKKDPITIIRNHREYIYDSSITIRRIVPTMTAGYLKWIKRNDKSEIIAFLVSFSKQDTTYTLSFVREDIISAKRTDKEKSEYVYDRGSFILAANAVIYFRGQEFNVNASQVSVVKKIFNEKTRKLENKTEPCRLVYYRTISNASSEDVNRAEGWKNTPTPTSTPTDTEYY